jgi:HSP20 family protein
MAKRDVEEWFWQLGEIQSLSEEMLRARPQLSVGRAWEPRADVFEEEHRILVKVEIAGVRGEDIQLLYVPERHSLVLKGTRQEESFPDCCPTGIHQLEIFYGPFQREIELPDQPVDSSKIRAQYRNGFLIILVPKLERIVTSRTITIREI